jgi:hypothetical protein
LSPWPLPTALLISVAQFARTLLPSKIDVLGSTPQTISAVGTLAAQIASPTAPWWPFSAPLRPAIVAVIVGLVARVHGHCHHFGKPVQAGGEVDQVSLPAPLRCIAVFLAMGPPPLLLPLIGGEDDAHSTNADSSPAVSASAVCWALKACVLLDQPLPAGHAGSKDSKRDCGNNNKAKLDRALDQDDPPPPLSNSVMATRVVGE